MLGQSEQTVATANSNHNNNINHNNNNLLNTTAVSKAKVVTQQLLNNGTPTKPPGHEYRQRRHNSPEERHATGNGIAHSTVDKKIWLYFERSQSDATKLKCLLCSTELCNKLSHDLQQNSSMHSLLWNHLRVKHAIERDTDDSSGEEAARVASARLTRGPAEPEGKQQQHNSGNSKPEANKSPNDETQARTRNTTTNTTNNNSHTRAPSSAPSSADTQTKTTTTTTTTNMTNTKQHQVQIKCQSSANAKKSPPNNYDINELRRKLDLLEYNDFAKASLKPSPTSSLSKNLFERLNQISSPVTRKLKFWNKKSFQVNQYDPCFKVIYLGNLGVQFWSKDESCLEKPLNTLWNNYLVNMKTEIVMRLTICNSGLKAITRQHGLTQYWSNRLVYCCSHKNYPKIFSWIYRHEGKKMRQELRCHAVFCSSPERASKMVSLLNQRLTCALEEFMREKKSRGQSPSILAKFNSSSGSSSSEALLQTTLFRTIPLRRQILAKGSANFRPPLERSKSAPKLTSIREEDQEIEDEEEEDEHDVAQDNVKEDGRSVVDRQLNGDNKDDIASEY